MAKNNYVNNWDLIREINKSKLSYCQIKKGHDGEYVARHFNLQEIKPHEGNVYRVYTEEHIPKQSRLCMRGPVRNMERVNFIPFKHYKYQNGKFIEIVRSHYKDDKFSNRHGKHTDELARMYLRMIDEFAKRPNWCGYSYLDEMKKNAAIHLVQGALMFDESKSNNPFSYLTQIISNAFLQVRNKEEEQQMVRDEIRIENGLEPSRDYYEKKERKMERDEKRRRKERLRQKKLREQQKNGNDIYEND